jgi:hypothetical protein
MPQEQNKHRQKNQRQQKHPQRNKVFQTFNCDYSTNFAILQFCHCSFDCSGAFTIKPLEIDSNNYLSVKQVSF